MATVALVWGILAFVGFGFGLLPCLGWMNWANIPFALVGAIVAAVAWSKESRPGGRPAPAVAGLVLSLVAVTVGLIRLWLGGGIL